MSVYRMVLMWWGTCIPNSPWHLFFFFFWTRVPSLRSTFPSDIKSDLRNLNCGCKPTFRFCFFILGAILSTDVTLFLFCEEVMSGCFAFCSPALEPKHGLNALTTLSGETKFTNQNVVVRLRGSPRPLVRATPSRLCEAGCPRSKRTIDPGPGPDGVGKELSTNYEWLPWSLSRVAERSWGQNMVSSWWAENLIHVWEEEDTRCGRLLPRLLCWGSCGWLLLALCRSIFTLCERLCDSYLVDPASGICLSQGLSHASASMSDLYNETANGSVKQL